MFNKTTNKPAPVVPTARPQSAPAPAPVAEAPRRAARTGSSLGAGLVIDGNVTGSGDLVLDATVRGDVKVDHLVVGESGSIEGKVDAESIEVRGRIIGAITGKQVKLQATAYVEGDITHEALAIDVGAYFQGRCLQTRKAEAPAPASAPSASFGTPSLGSYDMNAISDLK